MNMSNAIKATRISAWVMAIFFSVQTGMAMVPVSEVSTTEPAGSKRLTYSKGLTVAEAEKVMGRDMSGIERMAFKTAKKRYVKAYNKAADKGETDGFAIAGFVTSLLIPVVGLVLSAIALGRIRKNNTGGRGLATAGLVIGIVFTVVGLLLIL